MLYSERHYQELYGEIYTMKGIQILIMQITLLH